MGNDGVSNAETLAFGKLSAVVGRFLVICGALLVVVANVVLGDGTYQRTRDGKVFVWNNYPKPGEEATWSGGRDREGYARGFGVLTWYTMEQSESGSVKPALYARYWGNMIRGKFDGPVNVHSKRKTHYAIFADGVRSTRWAAGSAPSRTVFAEPTKKSLAASRAEHVEPESPAEGPLVQRSEVRDQRSEISRQRPEFREPTLETRDQQSSGGWPQIDIDDSLRILVWPPRSLRMTRGPRQGANLEGAPPLRNARLTKEEAIGLADALARSHGYDLDEYERSEPQYDRADETWSLVYNRKPVDETTGKYFSVAVGDKTKRATLVARR